MENRMMIAVLLVAACFCLLAPDAGANNIAVANSVLWNQDVGASNVYVEFDLNWENSWRTEVNWDAAWVFVKFKPEGSNDWQHATLSTNDGNHFPAPGSTINTPSDGKGVFIYRSGNGTGDVNYVRTRLRWDYGLNGYNFQKGDKVDISVHAIEMVYIPQGQFYLGSGGSESGHFYQYTDGTQSTNAYVVTNKSAIITSTNTWGDLWGTGGTSGDSAVAPSSGSVISNAFPKGYNAFYCMKSEISQGQYAAFLNKLNNTQDDARYYATVANRYTISGSYTNYSASVPDRACNWISWMDDCAYADWAGLRPMTELEFEKACRGTESPVANEYAWGSNNIYGTAYSLTNNNLPNERVSNPGIGTGNASYSTTDGSLDGPLRCGIFAGSITNPSRAGAGATYYDVMEMSGNLWEKCVTVGNAAGRVFRGTHGDGVLSSAGHATNDDWPGYGGGVVTGADGAGFRGGAWCDVAGCARVSDRGLAASANSARHGGNGWRASRAAPAP